ncbi:MAG: GAF domain-containing protein, partial [Actinomycetia bacterium]|nr:GAF domain-containing protein [Actinomycetes bacterium]
MSILFAAISLSAEQAATGLETRTLLVLGASSLYTLFLVSGHKSIFQLLQRYPTLMLVDVFISFTFVYLTGANDSPFMLYAHAPLATFSLLRGYRTGLIAMMVSAAAFIGSIWYKSAFTVVSLTARDFGTFAGFLLLFFLFSILSNLSAQSLEKNSELEEAKNRLALANEELESVNRQMIALQDISAVFQSFRDLPSTIDIVLDGIKYGLGYDRVVMGLFGTQRDMIASFHGVGPSDSNRKSDFSKTPLIGGEAIDPLFEFNEPTRVDSQEDERSLPDNVIDFLKLKSYIVVPLTVADKRIGIVIADNQNSMMAIDSHNVTWLKLLSSHAAVAINNAHLHTKTQELAVLTERNRIAMEIHDGLSQTLSGARLILDSCQQMVESRPEVVRSKMTYLDGILGRSYEE